MPVMKLSRGFEICPEGTYVFRIYESKYDADFGKVEVGFVNANGDTVRETFNLTDANGILNERALRSLSFLCRVALNDMDLDECDPEAIVNHFIEGKVEHTQTPSKKDPTKTSTFANIKEKKSASGWDKQPCEKALTLGTKVDMAAVDSVIPTAVQTPTTAEPQPSTPAAGGFDLDSFLKG